MHIIITSPSLDPSRNVSGVSSVTQFIINNNTACDYIHFEIGRADGRSKGFRRITSNLWILVKWVVLLIRYRGVLIHYNFPLERPSILRDPIFMRVARLMGHRLVVHVHGGRYLTAPHIPRIFRKRLMSVFRWNVPFIVLSDNESDILIKRFCAKNVVVLPNCVDLQDASCFERKEQNPHLPLVMGYLGRIAMTKGMDYLLYACQDLKAQGIPFVLRMAGIEELPGSYLHEFGKLGDSFEYCGLVGGQSKCDFLRSLDAFVLPTFFEGLPMSMLECMSYGAVPITTPVGSIPTVVKHDVNGLFVNVKDSQSIVDAVLYLSSHRDVSYRLGQEARVTIFREFSPKKYVETLNQVYNKAL